MISSNGSGDFLSSSRASSRLRNFLALMDLGMRANHNLSRVGLSITSLYLRWYEISFSRRAAYICLLQLTNLVASVGERNSNTLTKTCMRVVCGLSDSVQVRREISSSVARNTRSMTSLVTLNF